VAPGTRCDCHSWPAWRTARIASVDGGGGDGGDGDRGDGRDVPRWPKTVVVPAVDTVTS